MKKLLTIALLAISASAFGADLPFTESYRSFTKGLNTRTSPIYVSKQEATELVNLDIDEEFGTLTTRKGYDKCGNYPTGKEVLNVYEWSKDASTKRLIATDGETIYATGDCQDWTLITSGHDISTQWRFETVINKLWAVSKSTYAIAWDGVNTTTVTAAPIGSFVKYWKNRVWIGDISTDSSKLMYSMLVSTSGALLDPIAAEAFPALNAIYVNRSDGYPITGIQTLGDYLYVFKESGITAIAFSDEYNINMAKTSVNVGCISGDTIKEWKGNLVYLGSDGNIYGFNGNSVNTLSDTIYSKTKIIKQPKGQLRTNTYATTGEWNLGTLTGTGTIDTGLYVLKQSSYTGNLFTNLLAMSTPLIYFATSTVNYTTTTDAGTSWTHTSPNGFFYTSGMSIGDTYYGMINHTAKSPLYGFSGAGFTQNELVYVSGSVSQLATGNNMVVLQATDATLSNSTGVCVNAIKDGTAAKLYIATCTYASGSFATSSTPTIVNYTNFHYSYNSQILVNTIVNLDGSVLVNVNHAASCSGSPCVESIKTVNIPSGFIDTSSTETYKGFITSHTAAQDFGSYVSNVYYVTNPKPVSTASWVSDIYFTIANSEWRNTSITAANVKSVVGVSTVNYYYRVDASPVSIATQTWKYLPLNSQILEANTSDYIQLKVDLWDIDTATSDAKVNQLRYQWFSGTEPKYSPKAIVYEDKYYMTASTGQLPYIDTMLKLSMVPNLHWTTYDIPAQGLTLYNGDLYAAKASTDNIIHLMQGSEDDGEPIAFSYATGDNLVQYPYYPKYIQYVLIDYYRQTGQSFNVSYSTDGGLTYTDKAVDMGSGKTKTRGLYRWACSSAPSTMFRIKLWSSGTSVPLQFYGFDAVGTIRPIIESGR